MTTWTLDFCDAIPLSLLPETLHISMQFRTVTHLCACGCGSEVVTPLAPDMWTLRFDGDGVTLRPSVGSYNLPCRSHYLVTDSRIEWLPSPGAIPTEASMPEPSNWVMRLVAWVRHLLRRPGDR